MFSEVLFNLRKKHGLTQKELADKLGVAASTIGNYEQGTRTPDYETLEVIADFFNVPMDSLFGKNNNNNSFISNDVLKFALFGGDKEISDEQLEEVKRFAKFVKDRDKNE